MTAFTLPIPTYHRHKRVQALRIKAVVPNPRGYELHFEDERFCPIEVVDEWIWKALVERFIPYSASQGLDWGTLSSGGTDYKRLVGCYVVWNEDGHVSISPATAFEAGYTLVEDRQPVREVLSDDLSKCQRALMEAGKPYPKTCPVCGLGGKCKRDEPLPVGPATQAAREVGK